MSKLVLALGAIFLLSSCVSAPPTADQIHAKVLELIGEPVTPDSPTMTILTEPTGVRWTIFRPAEPSSITTPDGKGRDAADPVRDNLLGISFGHGLFLDTAGNLSILPLRAWTDVWKTGEMYQADVTPTIWGKNVRKFSTVLILPNGVRVLQKGTFGLSQQDYPNGADSVVAFHKRAALKDALWWETTEIQLLEAVHSLGYTKNGIEHILHHMTKDSIRFEKTTNGVQSSDGYFHITVEGDHWILKIPSHEWWIFMGASKLAIFDIRTGNSAVISQSTDGASVLSDRGNLQQLVRESSN